VSWNTGDFCLFYLVLFLRISLYSFCLCCGLSYCTTLQQYCHIYPIRNPAKYWVQILTRRWVGIEVIFAVLPRFLCLSLYSFWLCCGQSYCTILQQYWHIYLIRNPSKYWVQILTRRWVGIQVIFAVLPRFCVFLCLSPYSFWLCCGPIYCTILQQYWHIYLIKNPAKYWVQILTMRWVAIQVFLPVLPCFLRVCLYSFWLCCGLSYCTISMLRKTSLLLGLKCYN
jgi:hypothetical protein